MPVGDIKTKSCYAVNKKKKMSDVGEIIVNAPQTPDAVSFAIELKNLLDSSHLFYGKEKSREDSELKNIGVTIPETPGIDNIMLIRVGRHSGTESVTIEKYRDIKIMLENRKHTFKDHTTTLWLASEVRKPELLPFGWAVLSPLTLDMEKQLKVNEAAFQNNRNQTLIEGKKKTGRIALTKEAGTRQAAKGKAARGRNKKSKRTKSSRV